MSFLQFLAYLGAELVELFQYAQQETPDPEVEKQIAARIIRRTSDARARRDFGG